MPSISMLCTQQHTNSPRVGLDSHFSGESVSFRDYTLPVKIDMSAPGGGRQWDVSQKILKITLSITHKIKFCFVVCRLMVLMFYGNF